MVYFYGAFFGNFWIFTVFAPFHFYCIKKNGENILPNLSFCVSQIK